MKLEMYQDVLITPIKVVISPDYCFMKMIVSVLGNFRTINY